MPLSIAALLAVPELGLRELHRAPTSDRPISWASSSDLLDPTPFLVADQLLLTTGRQFPDDADDGVYRAYVDALLRRDVLGIGFGTEVLQEGTPAGLVAACRDAGLALVEVPYRTPFLAIIRRVAREGERAARARDDWALSASRAISAAALSQGEVAAVLRELAARLAVRVMLFDAEGELEAAYPRARPGDPAEPVAAEVRRLLAAGSRGASEDEVDGVTTAFQTIGPAGALAGVLTLTGPRPDRAARTVLAAAVALVEVGVAASRRAARGSLARNAVVLRLLRERRADLAATVAAAGGARIPDGRAAVVVTATGDGDSLRALAEREARVDERLVTIEGELLVCIAPARSASAVAQRLAPWGHAVGTAVVDDPSDADAGIARADAARRSAAPGGVRDWAELPTPGALEDAAGIATALLAAIAATASGRAEIAAATAWFAENCNWGGAARRLGIHPHSVRDRVTALAARVDADLAAFEGRARLWSMLRGAGLG